MYLREMLGDLDPKTANYPWSSDDEIWTRAQRILAKRSSDEMRFAIQLASSISMAYDEEIQQALKKKFHTDGGKIRGRLTPICQSPAVGIQKCMEKYYLPPMDELQGATWSEIFAGLAIGLLNVADKIKQSQIADVKAGNICHPVVFSHGDDYCDFLTKYALEAVTIAEYLESAEVLADELAERKVSQKNRINALEKYDDINKIKQRCWEYWRTRDFKNPHQCAISFYDNILTNEDRRLLICKKKLKLEDKDEDCRGNGIQLLHRHLLGRRKEETHK